MGTEQEDAAKWRQYTEFNRASERLAQLRKEVKLMVVAPLGELFYAIRDNPDKLATIDLSIYPDKSELTVRQQEMATLQKRVDELTANMRIAGVAVF